MNHFILIVVLLVGLITILGGAWLVWQLLRQNGRLLLRLDELEKRLNQLEFGDSDGREGLPLGSEAPAFELSDLAGERRSLAQYRGQPVLLIFFNPDCGFCRDLASKLAAQLLEGRAPRVPAPPNLQEDQGLVELGPPIDQNHRLVILTTGDAEVNRRFFTEHKIGCPVLLQKDGDIATAYQANGTPSGYLISAEGRIATELAMGAEALLKLATEPHGSRGNEALTEQSEIRNPKSEIRNPKSEIDESLLTSAATIGDGGAPENRFNNRSLARSKIKRDGLKAGTPAPDLKLPRLDGRGDLSLEELRGSRVLLVFSDPHCGPCNALAPELEKFHRLEGNASSFPGPRQDDGLDPETGTDRAVPSNVQVVMISRGEPKENRTKVKEHGLTFPIVLQQQWEISRRYAMFATPVAYLIDERGVIAGDVAVGVEPIQALLEELRTEPAIEVTEV